MVASAQIGGETAESSLCLHFPHNMDNFDKEKVIRNIENAVDVYYQKHEFYRVPENKAVQNLLIAYEENNLLPFYAPNPYGFKVAKELSKVDEIKFALTIAINWVSRSDVLPNIHIDDLEESTFMSSINFLELAGNYSGVVCAYTTYSRGISEALLIDDKTVKFTYPAAYQKYQVFSLMHFAQTTSDYNPSTDERLIGFKKGINAIYKTIKPYNKFSVTYSTQDIDKKALVEYFKQRIPEAAYVPPSEWSFNNIRCDNFIDFWAAVNAICFIHVLVNIYCIQVLNKVETSLGSRVIYKGRKEWIRQISSWASLPKEITGTILEYHTYSIKHQRPDIALTPFIATFSDSLMLAPHLITTSNIGRNLLKHLAKNHRNEFDKQSDIFANKMIANILNVEKGSRFLVSSGLNVAGDKTLPDIDLLIYDKEDNDILICECKWMIQSADPHEVTEVMNKAKEGVGQLIKLRNHLNSNKKELQSLFNSNTEFSIDKINQIYYACVVENDPGYGGENPDDIPFIENSVFCKYLKEKSSIKEIYHCLTNKEFLPGNDDYTPIEIKHSFGEYTVIWGGHIV